MALIGIAVIGSATMLASCGSEPEESDEPTQLSSEEKIALYTSMLQARDTVYLQQVSEATGRPVTDPDSVIKSAFVICGHIAQATGPEQWVEFSTAFAKNAGITLETAGLIFGSTLEGYCPVLKDHYFDTVVKTN